MKILLDSCVWVGVQASLAELGYDVDWVGHWDHDPGDRKIMAQAFSSVSVLVTLDKDFGELAVLRAQPHAGILRLVGLSTRQQGEVCQAVLARFGDDLAAGAIVTADGNRVRVRRVE